MELTDILTILGALGGFEAIRWTITFLVNRRTNARKEAASATSVEITNLLTIIDLLKQENARISVEKIKRDEKVDALYIELRSEQSDKARVIQEKHAVELERNEALFNRCEIFDCLLRIPPRGSHNKLKEE